MIAIFLVCETSLLGYKVGLKWFVIVALLSVAEALSTQMSLGFISLHIGVGVIWTVVPSHDINVSWHLFTDIWNKYAD